MLRTKIFTEIGIGNQSFISTEVERGEREHRVRGFIRMRVRAIYLRLWVGRTAYILSTKRGFETMPKNRKAFKLLLGFEGIPLKSKP